MKSNSSNLRRFLSYARPYRWWLVLSMVIGVIKYNLPVAFPWILKDVIDHLLSGKPSQIGLGFDQLMGLAVLLFLFYAVVTYVRTYIADHLAHESWPMLVPHAASKGALETVTRQLAAQLAPRVRVNAVVPGAVLPPEGWPESARRAFEEATPLRRLGSPDDVAQAVVYLASAPYVTGQLLFVDGGRHLG